MYIQLTSIAQPNLGYVAKGAGNSERSKVASYSYPFLSLNVVAMIRLALMPYQSLHQVIQLYKEKQHINSFN